jgi:hypothetical protein
MHSLAQRVEAPFAAIVGTEWPRDQPERRTLRDTYRLAIHKLHDTHSVLGYTLAVDARGRRVADAQPSPCYEIVVDGRKAGIAQDCGDHGWFFQATNEDGADVNAELPQAVGAMVRSYKAGIAPDAEAMRVFDAWTLLAEANARARSEVFLSNLRSA